MGPAGRQLWRAAHVDDDALVSRDRIDRAFGQLIDGCAAHPVCSNEYGNLDADIASVREMHSAPPAEVEADIGDGIEHFVITVDDTLAGLFNAMYDATLIPNLPSVVDGLRRGETGVLPVLVERGVPFATGFADLMAFAVNCADNADLEMIDADTDVFDNPDGLGLVTGQPGVSLTIGRQPRGDFNAPVSSDISRSYSPVRPLTPNEGTWRAAGTFAPMIARLMIVISSVAAPGAVASAVGTTEPPDTSDPEGTVECPLPNAGDAETTAPAETSELAPAEAFFQAFCDHAVSLARIHPTLTGSPSSEDAEVYRGGMCSPYAELPDEVRTEANWNLFIGGTSQADPDQGRAWLEIGVLDVYEPAHEGTAAVIEINDEVLADIVAIDMRFLGTFNENRDVWCADVEQVAAATEP